MPCSIAFESDPLLAPKFGGRRTVREMVKLSGFRTHRFSALQVRILPVLYFLLNYESQELSSDEPYK